MWARIETGTWDTSAFEQSDAYAVAKEEQGRCRYKAEKQRVMQQAYELWLVREHNKNE